MVDLETLMAAIALCRVATRTSDEAAGQERKPSEKGRQTSNTVGDSDDAYEPSSSDEEWVVETDLAGARSHGNRLREKELLEGIKRSVEQLARQVAAMKRKQESSNSSGSSASKDQESEKVVLSGMFPHTKCRHESKIWYGNQYGHGLKCAACNVKVFRRTNGDTNIKVPK